MPKDFDSTLSDALDLAAHSAQTDGPAAARIPGRQRTMRKRIALSTASLALIAVGATAAFKVAAPGNNGAPVLTKPTPSVSVSATPTLTQGSASLTAGATPSNPASSGPNTSTSASSSPLTSTTSTGASPLKVATAAWLSPSQMPFASTFNWTATKTSQDAPGWQALTPTVYYFPSTDQRQALTTCGDPTSFLSRTIGGQFTQYTATTPPTTAKANNQASQYIFFFANICFFTAAYYIIAGHHYVCLMRIAACKIGISKHVEHIIGRFNIFKICNQHYFIVIGHLRPFINHGCRF